ncbi:MAG: hypothetical protein RJB13_566 [Pseudomonadota bacterium]
MTHLKLKATMSSKATKLICFASVLGLAASCAESKLSTETGWSKSLSQIKGKLGAYTEKISFDEWCERWGLTCPVKDEDTEIDSSEENFSESNELRQWRVIADLLEKAVLSGSDFSIEQQELNSARVRIFMQQLGLGDVHGDVLNALSKSGIKKLALEPSGRVRFQARETVSGQSGVLRGNSGLNWIFASNGEFSVGAQSQYLFNGLQFAAANALESDEFGSLGYTDEDKIVWSGQNLAVTKIPADFLIKDVPVRWEKFGELQEEVLIRNITEARNIALANNRNLKLNSKFFDAAASHAGEFTDDPKIQGALKQLLDSFGLFEMRQPTSSIALANVSLQQAERMGCRIEMSGVPAIEVGLSRSFGIQNIFTNEKKNAQIDLYGINIKVRIGFPISFNLKRVDVEPTKIVIKGVPVIGEISIPLPGSDSYLGKELKKLECVGSSLSAQLDE